MALKHLFDLPSIQHLTRGMCTFNGLSTWVDLAMLMSASVPVDWNNFLTPSGLFAQLGYVVEQQAEWVGKQTCDWQRTRTFRGIGGNLWTSRQRPDVFRELDPKADPGGSHCKSGNF
jgi:hypothetical protein